MSKKHEEEDGVGCMKRLCTFSGQDEVTTNDDLLIEILLWLPAKSLTRFKLVSKHWSSLIATHRFSHLHTLRHPKPQHSLLLRSWTSRKLFYFSLHAGKKLVPLHFTIPDTVILNSCNGLLLLPSNIRIKEYYVYNPTTMQSRKIFLTDNHEYPFVQKLNLAFDPSRSPHYKIVCIRTASITRPSFIEALPRFWLVELYDSETLSWRSYLHSDVFGGYRIMFPSCSNGAHWNNVIYWGDPFTPNYYDINKNIFGILPLAQIPGHESGISASLHARFQLQVSDAHLYQIILISSLEEKSITIFELEADHSQWLLLYHDVFDQPPNNTRILSFVRRDGEQASTLVFHVPGKIIAYRFSDKSYKELMDLKNEQSYLENSIQFEDSGIFQFGETLANV